MTVAGLIGWVSVASHAQESVLINGERGIEVGKLGYAEIYDTFGPINLELNPYNQKNVIRAAIPERSIFEPLSMELNPYNSSSLQKIVLFE